MNKPNPKLYLPSSTPSKTWELVALPSGAIAYEGVKGPNSFTFEVHLGRSQNPATRVAIQRPATAKRKAAALEQLQRQLIEAGLALDPASVNP